MDLSQPLPADMPVTPVADPAPPAEAPRAADLDLAPAPSAEAAADDQHPRDAATGDGDDSWAALDRAMTPVLEQALALVPDAGDDADDDERTALAGPTDPLPEVHSFEDLIAGVRASHDPGMMAIAGDLASLVDDLHSRYDRERKTREVRADAARLRRELDQRLAMLARLAGAATLTEDAEPAAAAA